MVPVLLGIPNPHFWYSHRNPPHLRLLDFELTQNKLIHTTDTKIFFIHLYYKTFKRLSCAFSKFFLPSRACILFKGREHILRATALSKPYMKIEVLYIIKWRQCLSREVTYQNQNVHGSYSVVVTVSNYVQVKLPMV
jgi:hypothetical protein